MTYLAKFLTPVVLVLAAMPSAAHRAVEDLGTLGDHSELDPEKKAAVEVLPEGVAFIKFDNSKKEQLGTVREYRVEVLVQNRGLSKEYTGLTKALINTPRGTMNSFKCSALYRTMYVGGYEAKFKAKNVDMYLTKEATGLLKPSDIRLWFVDRTVESKFAPPQPYRDGWADTTRDMYRLREDRRVPKPWESGVATQPFDGFVKSDKSSMPVDVLRILEAKGVMEMHVDMAAKINLGDGTPFWAAWQVEAVRNGFREHGVDLFFIQKKTEVDCKSSITSLFTKNSPKRCYETEHWFEYYNLDVVDEYYRPKLRYPKDRSIAYVECMFEKNSRKVAKFASEYVRSLGESGTGCSVKGSVKRDKGGGCKCVDKDMFVFCGKKKVAERKFDLASMQSLNGCALDQFYCAERACRMPDW